MKNILVVDDSRLMRQMLSYTLQQSGYQVSEAADGMEALELAGQTSFDLVLTDQNMPRMDGLALIEGLRLRSAYYATPLLILTTDSGLEMKARARAVGASGWIVKPFDPQSLISTVVRMIG